MRTSSWLAASALALAFSAAPGCQSAMQTSLPPTPPPSRMAPPGVVEIYRNDNLSRRIAVVQTDAAGGEIWLVRWGEYVLPTQSWSPMSNEHFNLTWKPLPPAGAPMSYAALWENYRASLTDPGSEQMPVFYDRNSVATWHQWP